jgi:hypothetical protein
MSKESRIILIQDLLDQKKRKQKELEFYKSKVKEFKQKLDLIQRELALTETIIKIIEKDKVPEIKKC